MLSPYQKIDILKYNQLTSCTPDFHPHRIREKNPHSKSESEINIHMHLKPHCPEPIGVFVRVACGYMESNVSFSAPFLWAAHKYHSRNRSSRRICIFSKNENAVQMRQTHKLTEIVLFLIFQIFKQKPWTHRARIACVSASSSSCLCVFRLFFFYANEGKNIYNHLL